MNEKRIYEWLRPELKGKKWWETLRVLGGSKQIAVKIGGKTHEMVLPPLDYNTLHNEVVPKLKAEGISVTFAHDHWFLQPCEPQFACGFDNTDWREALDALLAAREGK